MTKYEIGNTYAFDVIRDFGEDEDFFRIIVPEMGEVHLPKLKFQKEEPLPAVMCCRVKAINNGFPTLSHYMPDYVNRFYRNAQIDHRAVEFKVISLPSKKNDAYVLEDKYGIRYNLFENSAFLAKGQLVYCRFDKLTDNFYSLKISKSDVLPPYYRPSEILGKICCTNRENRMALKLLSSYIPEAWAEYQQGSPFWVLTAMKSALPIMSAWYLSDDFQRLPRVYKHALYLFSQCGHYLLERSRFLRNLDDTRRHSLQQVLTDIIDSLEPLRKACDISTSHREGEFVETLTSHLGESGYLYHPDLQLSVLMLILQKNPGMIRDYLGGIFDTIMGWKLATWTSEPFRKAFIDQFEIYIQQASREIDLFPQADREADTDRIEKIVTAIALQMLISADPTSDLYRRNRSLFYRYISLQRPVKSDILLDKAFRTLMGANLPLEFNYDNIRQPQMLMTCAAIEPTAGMPELSTVHRYLSGDVELTVGPEGCSIRRTDEDSAGRIIPNGMMDWLSPQVYLKNFQSLSGNQISSFDAHKRLWSNIEKSLFEQRQVPSLTPEERQKAEVGDDVLIIISPEITDRSDNPAWMAQIDDENFITQRGYITREDIVNYKITAENLERERDLAYSAFMDESNRPRHFYAKVLEIDTDGLIHFSLAEDVAQQLTENMNDYDSYEAVIANTNAHIYNAISEAGYGVVLQRLPGMDFQNGDVVRCHITNKSNPQYIQGQIDALAEDSKFNKTRGFVNLMKAISVTTEVEDLAEEEDILIDADESLSDQDVEQIVELIRFKALSSTNLLVAFDYLNFARLLALMLNDERLALRLRVHAELLRLHQFYATNRRVDAEELEKFRPDVEGYPLLGLVFHRLEIVSWLGDSDHNNDLWETITNSRNHLETSLAQLVLSYNMLPHGEEDDAISEGLKKKIAQTLGLNFEVRQLKSYGSENQFTEFKSSLVYPASGKKDKNAADPAAQQQVILKTIASFLNSDGGTLYIGVNDKTHCEAGLFEDFEYYKHFRPSDGKNLHTIKNVDNLCVFLTNLVCNKWGNVVAGSIQFDVDNEASHDVIIVNVKPRVSPVFLDDVLYVRRSNNSKALRDRELQDFIEDRRMLELRRREELREAIAVEADITINQCEENKPTEPKVNDTAVVKEKSEGDTKQIATSKWRQNVLHNWEEGFVEPAGYYYFNGENSFIRTSVDRSYDYNEDCSLSLCFSAREAEQGFLILVFDNQRVLKVPMSEILEKDEDRKIGFYSGAQPLFGTIALSCDALLCHLADSKGNLSRRVIPISEIEQQHLTSTPEPICTVPGQYSVEACEIVAASAFPVFSGSMTKDLSSRQLGYLLRANVNTAKAQTIFEEDCMNSKPV